MNLDSLGRTLADVLYAVTEKYPEFGPVWQQGVNTYARASNALEEFFNGYDAAVDEHEQNEPVDADEPDYHCNDCKMQSAPVAELTTKDMLYYMQDGYMEVSKARLDVLNEIDEKEVELYRPVIEKWFLQAREEV